MIATLENHPTLEAPEKIEATEPVDPIHSFVMPRPEIGQCITWFPSGERKGGETSFVLNVGRRNIVLRTATGTPMETVRHIDDPKLKLNADQRMSGAWDFTDESKQAIANNKRLGDLESLCASLVERVTLLEGFFNEPKKKKPE